MLPISFCVYLITSFVAAATDGHGQVRPVHSCISPHLLTAILREILKIFASNFTNVFLLVHMNIVFTSHFTNWLAILWKTKIFDETVDPILHHYGNSRETTAQCIDLAVGAVVPPHQSRCLWCGEPGQLRSSHASFCQLCVARSGGRRPGRPGPWWPPPAVRWLHGSTAMPSTGPGLTHSPSNRWKDETDCTPFTTNVVFLKFRRGNKAQRNDRRVAVYSIKNHLHISAVYCTPTNHQIASASAYIIEVMLVRRNVTRNKLIDNLLHYQLHYIGDGFVSLSGGSDL